jgi:hypothetical protein
LTKFLFGNKLHTLVFTKKLQTLVMNQFFTKIVTLTTLCIATLLYDQQLSAQCLNQGTITSPGCGASVTQSNVGGKQNWTLTTVNGADYTVSISAGSNGCGAYGLSTTSFTGSGSNVSLDVTAGGSCCWASGGTSAVLTYTRTAVTNTTSTAGMCGNGSTRSLTGTGSGGTWSLFSGPGSVAGSTYTATGSGTAVIRYTKGGCTADASIVVTANPGVASNTTSNSGMCGNGSTRSLTGTPSGGSWLLVSGPGAIAGSTYTATGSGNAVIRYTIAASGSCPATTSDITIPVTADPGVANNTTSISQICGNSSTRTLTGTPSGGTFSLFSGPGGVASTTYTAPGSGSGTAVVRYTIAASGSCLATTSDVSIPVNENPVITSPVAVCDASTAAVTATVGTVTVSLGTWSGGTFTPPNIGGSTQNQNVTITATNGACVPTATIRVDNNTTAAAGLNQSQCNNGNFTLAGNDPSITVTGSTGTWTCQANCAGISYVAAGTYNTSMSSVPTNTTTTSRWTVVNGVCSNFDDVDTRNDGLPSVSGPSSVCDVDGVVSYTQTGGSGIVWSYTGSGASINSGTGDLTISNISTPTQSVSGTVRATSGSCFTDKAITIYNKTTFTNSFASLCEGQTVTLTADVTGTTFSGTGVSGGVFTAPTIGGTSQSFILTATNGPTSCQDQQIITVYKVSTISSSSADMCQGNTRALTATPGPGAFTSVACPSCIVGTTFTAPVPTGNSEVIDIVYTVSGAPCSSTQNITVHRTPTTASVGATQNICGLTSNSLGGNTPTYGTGAWTQNSGPGTTTFSASGSGSSTATASTYGTYVYRWTISNGSCTSTTADITVVYDAPASVPTSGGDVESCYRQSVPDQTASVGGGETIDWYDAPTGGTLILPNSLTYNEVVNGYGPNPPAGTYTLYAEGRNTTTNCPSPSRTAVTLTVRAVPVISPTATPNTACSGDAVVLDANATAGSGTITAYAWSSGLGAVASGTVNPTSTTTYTVTVTNSYSCTNDASATVTIKTGAAYVVLPPSTVTTAVEQCSDGGWTYYANASTPDDWIFAIRKNGNTFTAEVDITVLGSRASVDNINTTKAGWEHGSYLMTRYWNATVLTGSISTPVDVKFYYDPAEKTDAESARDAAWASYMSTTKTAFRWFKTVGTSFGSTEINAIDGNSFNAFSNITLTESASGTDNGITYAQFDGITSFSGGTGGYGFSGAPAGLPVKLIDFTATAVENNYIRLDWSTALELNNAGFEIERSTNGSEFTKIGWVQGHDNSTVTQVYSYNDKTAQPNIRYYYRLKQIDNGNVAFEYSNIVTAMFINEGKTAVGDFVPNPAKDKASIDLFIGADQTVVVDVYEITGKYIKSEKLDMKKGFNTYFIQTEDMSAATYVVSFKMDDQRISKRLNVLK